MLKKLKALLRRYDKWCHSMGLTPSQKRSCVPVKQENTEKTKQG